MIIQKRKQMFVAKQKGMRVVVIGSFRHAVFKQMENLIVEAWNGSNGKQTAGR